MKIVKHTLLLIFFLVICSNIFSQEILEQIEYITTPDNGMVKAVNPVINPTPIPTPPMPNIAVNRPAKASSCYPGPFNDGYINDGDMSTIWAPDINSNKSWVYIDLESVRNINGLGIFWFEKYYAKRYRIAISNDGVNWRFVFTGIKNSADNDKIFGDGLCRYIGFLFEQKNDITIAIREIEVYSSIPIPTTNND